MKLVFCGSGSFALPTLRALAGSSYELAAVVTQPPRPAGRGGRLRATEVDEFATASGIEVLRWADINAPTAVAKLRELAPDVTVVAEFGQFIRAEARQAARVDIINLHASVLPELRGAAPVNWAIIRGYEITGVSTFSVISKMDAGAVYRRAHLAIRPHERADSLRKRLAELGAGEILRTLEDIAAGVAPREQDHEKATSAPSLKKPDGYLDFTQSAKQVSQTVRGTWPWPAGHARFAHRGGKTIDVILAQAIPVDGEAAGEPGRLNEDLLVQTGEGLLDVLEVKPAGKRLMPWKDFINGYRVSPGDRFLPPEVH